MSILVQFNKPDWLNILDQNIEDKISILTNDYILDDKEVKTIINEFLQNGFFYKKNIDLNQYSLSTYHSLAVFITQTRHHEKREITANTIPFNNQDMGFENILEDVWENDPFKKYEHNKLKWVRGGSAKVSECDDCRGDGERLEKCPKCSGEGNIILKCPNCKGKGIIIQGQVSVGGGEKIGGAVGYSQKAEQCLRCNAKGYLSEQCNKCVGNGKILIKCKQCNATGKLYYCQFIEAVAKPLKHNVNISPFGTVKMKWFQPDSIVFEEIYETNDFVDLGEMSASIPKNGKILVEKYIVKYLPVSKIVIEMGKKSYIFYVAGKNKLIFSDGIAFGLLDFKKVFLLSGISLVIVISIIFSNYLLK